MCDDILPHELNCNQGTSTSTTGVSSSAKAFASRLQSPTTILETTLGYHRKFVDLVGNMCWPCCLRCNIPRHSWRIGNIVAIWNLCWWNLVRFIHSLYVYRQKRYSCHTSSTKLLYDYNCTACIVQTYVTCIAGHQTASWWASMLARAFSISCNSKVMGIQI